MRAFLVLCLAFTLSSLSLVACGSASKCGPGNCPLGCCDASGACLPGNQPQACGAAGAVCTTCALAASCVQNACLTSSSGGGAGGGSGAGGGGGATVTTPGTCAQPGSTAFTGDTLEWSGLVAGTSANATSCTAATGGPEVAFGFSLASASYLFAAARGSATLAPTLSLSAGTTCSATELACGTTPNVRDSTGFQSSAVAAGQYVLLVDSQAGNGGSVEVVLSRSSLLGDECADARVLTLSGTRTIVAGSTVPLSNTFPTQCDTTNGPRGGDAIFAFTAPRSGMLTVTASPVGLFDVTLEVRGGASCASSMPLAACANGFSQSWPETVSVAVTSGSTYWIRVGGYSSPSDLSRVTLAGVYTLELSLP